MTMDKILSHEPMKYFLKNTCEYPNNETSPFENQYLIWNGAFKYSSPDLCGPNASLLFNKASRTMSGLNVSILFNQAKDMFGVNAGLANLAKGDMTGGNIALANLVKNNLTGGNVALISNLTEQGDMTGGNIALINFALEGDMTGGNIALINSAKNNMTGGNVALCMNSTMQGDMTGGNVAAINLTLEGDITGGNVALANFAPKGDITGGNVALANFAPKGDMTGGNVAIFNYAQNIIGGGYGVVNYAEDSMSGFQIGIVNRASKMKGVQIGLVNVWGNKDGSTCWSPIVGGLVCFSKGFGERVEISEFCTDDGSGLETKEKAEECAKTLEIMKGGLYEVDEIDTVHPFDFWPYATDYIVKRCKKGGDFYSESVAYECVKRLGGGYAVKEGSFLNPTFKVKHTGSGQVEQSAAAKFSADGEKIMFGDQIYVFSPSAFLGAAAAMDILTVTDAQCEKSTDINAKNGSGSVCIDPSYAYTDSGKAINAMISGGVNILPYQLSIHESD